MVVQQRQESGLRLAPGPRMITGNTDFEMAEPAPYLWGAGYELGDEDTLTFARRLVALIKERGVIWVPAQRYRNK
eukprot:3891982-Rhodomonas_salina.1